MKTRPALVLVVCLSAPALTAAAQPSGRVYRVGLLASEPTPGVQNFRQGLRDLGYIEGQNLVLEARSSPPGLLSVALGAEAE